LTERVGITGFEHLSDKKIKDGFWKSAGKQHYPKQKSFLKTFFREASVCAIETAHP